MVILDGGEQGFYQALGMVAENPNRMHVREYEAVEGREIDYRQALNDSLASIRVAAYAIHKDAALVCGIAHGIRRAALWMSTTDGAERYPRWLLRSMLKRLAMGEQYIGRGVTLYQWIPTFYVEGLHFVEHLGFRQARVTRSCRTGVELVVVEKESCDGTR